ncbi:pentapeptide repeat-containing protein [Parafrankia discariae]|uniref:pentapeptide repeat-containing protein n=1 Tax=Parafrankia discariae TaxID=365528 RepID=UPI00037BA631|nr:pentapeptide repeat-containing protein [Parafrankia discariae]
MADIGGAHRRAGRRWLWIVAGIAGVGAVAAVVGIWHLPGRMYPPGTDGAAEARAALQGGLLTAAAALTAVAGGLIALDETRQANANTHVRELYATAIGLLTADTVDSRLGGIYGLERIAWDSAADQRTVVEVLSAFVREHTRPGRPLSRRRHPAAWRFRMSTDVQAALTVLGRLPARRGIGRADLNGADLLGAVLIKADLRGAQLRAVNFTDAWLVEVNFTGAELSWATLAAAVLDGADFSAARLNGADFSSARGLTQMQVDAALGDDRTRLPAGLVRPASWGPEE